MNAWRQDDLSRFSSPKNKPGNADVCIIGTGAGGSSVASEFSCRGEKVIMVEPVNSFSQNRWTNGNKICFPNSFSKEAREEPEINRSELFTAKALVGPLHNIDPAKNHHENHYHWELKKLLPWSISPSRRSSLGWFKSKERLNLINVIPQMNSSKRYWSFRFCLAALYIIIEWAAIKVAFGSLRL